MKQSDIDSTAAKSCSEHGMAMSDIVTRLRGDPDFIDAKEAADEIERLRDEHAQAMTHLAAALNENQRLKRRDANVRIAASEVCDAYERMYRAQVDSSMPELLGKMDTVDASVRALSDAIGREPR